MDSLHTSHVGDVIVTDQTPFRVCRAWESEAVASNSLLTSLANIPQTGSRISTSEELITVNLTYWTSHS